MKQNTVYIVDAQVLTREGLKAIIAKLPEWKVLGTASTHNELLSISKIPDVFIVDCFLGTTFSPKDISLLKENYPSAKIMVLTTEQTQEEVLHIIDLGVESYLLKACSEAEMIHALNMVVKNEKFFCSRVMDTMVSLLTGQSSCGGDNCDNCKLFSISEREVEIIQLIAEGYTNKAIASKLCLSIHTIGSHRKNIFRKLKIRSASELTLYAIQKGIISPDTIEIN